MLSVAHHGSDIVICIADEFESKGIDDDLSHVRGEESGNCGADHDVFEAKIEQGKQDCDSFLLIPAQVEGDGEVVDIFEFEGIFESKCDHGE